MTAAFADKFNECGRTRIFDLAGRESCSGLSILTDSNGGVAISLGVVLWLFRSHPPEIETIHRVGSPNGTWIAGVQMVVYGDHWFVNDARYEVRVERANSRESVLVYSIPASGPAGIALKWQSEDELIVEDSLAAMRQADKNPHPLVTVDYRIR